MDKKKNNLFLKVLSILFIIFVGLFIASESGYYEAKLSEKVILTDQAIKEFEEDVLNGESVDINSYIMEENINYENSFTKAGDKLSELAKKFITDGLSGTLKALKSIFL